MAVVREADFPRQSPRRGKIRGTGWAGGAGSPRGWERKTLQDLGIKNVSGMLKCNRDNEILKDQRGRGLAKGVEKQRCFVLLEKTGDEGRGKPPSDPESGTPACSSRNAKAR